MTHHRIFPQRRALRLGAVAATVVASIGAATVVSGQVQAERPSMQTVNSPELADQAGNVLGAYQSWVKSKQPMAWVEYVAQRDLLAVDIAYALGIDGTSLSEEWANSPIQNQVIVVAALSQLGVKYRYNAMNPGGSFDCSGLTKWAYAQAGVDIPRVSSSQIRASETVDRADALPGDLVHYPGHIGLYLGQDGYIDSPNSGNVIRVHGLPSRSIRFGDAIPDA